MDGRVQPLAHARILLADRGFLLGDGVFETMRSRNGRVHAWTHHERRLRHGLAAIGLADGKEIRVYGR